MRSTGGPRVQLCAAHHPSPGPATLEQEHPCTAGVAVTPRLLITPGLGPKFCPRVASLAGKPWAAAQGCSGAAGQPGPSHPARWGTHAYRHSTTSRTTPLPRSLLPGGWSLLPVFCLDFVVVVVILKGFQSEQPTELLSSVGHSHSIFLLKHRYTHTHMLAPALLLCRASTGSHPPQQGSVPVVPELLATALAAGDVTKPTAELCELGPSLSAKPRAGAGPRGSGAWCAAVLGWGETPAEHRLC